jgi:RHS repeat-associated protein
MGQSLLRSGVVAASCVALGAGLLAGSVAPVSAASPASDDPVGATEVILAASSIQAVGPIATVAAATGSRWPAAVRTVAVMPRGSAMNGETPSISVPGLASEPSVDVSVIDLAREVGGADGTVWSGKARSGWVSVSQRLTPGRAYAVDARGPEGTVRVGTFTVARPGPGAGPTSSIGGMQISLIDGAVSWSWQSRSMPGPAGSAGVSLSWGSGVTGSQGVPEGWLLAAKSGSPWARLDESATQSRRLATRAAAPATGVLSASGPRAVTLRGWDGSTLLFTRTDQGLYEQATGAGRVPGLGNTLDPLPGGQWEFTDSDGTTTRFADGRAIGVEAKGAPVSSLTWDDAGRLDSLTNEIGRTLRLTYAGAGECPSASWTSYGFVAPPDGSLCRMTYPDGEATDFGYVAAGSQKQIGLIREAGNLAAALGWDTQGRLVSERSPLVGRAAMLDSSAASVVSRIEYDSRGRAARLIDAPATPGAASPTRAITFPVITDAALQAWAADPKPERQVEARVDLTGGGYTLARREWIDPATWQSMRTQDRTGLGTRLQGDLVDAGTQATVDEQGRIQRITRDQLGRPIATAGPSTKASGANPDAPVTTTDYDVDSDGGKDRRLAGLRAQEFPGDGLRGRPESVFWEVPRGRDGLAYRWTGRPSEWSALATGVWRPEEADDKAGARDGWTFKVEASGARVLVMVGSRACEPDDGTDTCTMDLPSTGPKQITVQLTAGRPSGAFAVSAAPVGQRLEPIGFGLVRPEYSNATVSTSNDVYPGSDRKPTTRVDYDDPASGLPTSVTDTAERTVSMEYEDLDPKAGRWGRITEYTTAGGETVRTQYWPNSGKVPLPPACGTGEAVASGQASTVTRQDGTSVTTYYDVQGRPVATQTSGGELSQVQCVSYHADGGVRQQRTFDVGRDGAVELLESVDIRSHDPAEGGNPLVTSTTTTLGEGAPVDAGRVVTTVATVDLLGRPVGIVDASGTTTTTTYDLMGQPASVTYDAPGPGASTTLTYAYRTTVDGAMTRVRVGDVTAATISYDSQTGRIASVDYPASTSSFRYGPDGRVVSKTVATDAGQRYTDQVTRSDFGRTLSADTRGPGFTEQRAYTYDDAGRLIRARITSAEDGGAPLARTFDYTFSASQAETCATSYSRAGLDNLRTGGARDGAAYVTCHDGKGRLDSTTDPLLTGGSGTATFAHDDLGRVTRIAGIDRPVSLTYGIGGDLAIVREAIDTVTPVTTELTRIGGSTLTRRVTSASGTSAVTFGAGGAVQLVTDDSGRENALLAMEIGLPGGARATIPARGAATIAHNAIAGEALVTTDARALGAGGSSTPGDAPGLADRVGPYGERLGAPDLAPDTASPDYLWHAATRADTLPGSAGITVVGARAYLPATGAFLTADSVIDSGQNLYGYTDGDPINAKDTSGNESETDWTWVWVAVGTAALSIALGVANNFVKLGKGFNTGNVVNPETGKLNYLRAYKEVFRTSPAKSLVIVGAVASGVAAGVATGMALRNQVSETWQAVAIGIGAAVATVGLAVGANVAVSKVLVGRSQRAARLAAQARPPSARLSVTSTLIDDAADSTHSSIRSARASGGEGAFVLKRAQGHWSGTGADPIFVSQRGGVEEAIRIKSL